MDQAELAMQEGKGNDSSPKGLPPSSIVDKERENRPNVTATESRLRRNLDKAPGHGPQCSSLKDTYSSWKPGSSAKKRQTTG